MYFSTKPTTIKMTGPTLVSTIIPMRRRVLLISRALNNINNTVLCKRNANEIRCFSFFVLAKIGRNFATKFRQSAREFSSSQTKFCCHLNEISNPLKWNFVLPKFRRSENLQVRNFAIAKIRTREISPGRKFAAAKFPQSEILLAVEEGSNENLLFGPL